MGARRTRRCGYRVGEWQRRFIKRESTRQRPAEYLSARALPPCFSNLLRPTLACNDPPSSTTPQSVCSCALLQQVIASAMPSTHAVVFQPPTSVRIGTCPAFVSILDEVSARRWSCCSLLISRTVVHPT